MSRYYVTAVVVVEADCADTAVNAVAIAVQNHAVETAACSALVVGLDREGEPIFEVCLEEGTEEDPDPVAISSDMWNLRPLETDVKTVRTIALDEGKAVRT